jgi:putative toxin-antitoxin system antitoxin component (TIGR02293 family)
MGITRESLFNVLGLPKSTIERKITHNQVLPPDQGERILGLAKLVGQVQVMVEQSGDPRGFDAAEWVASWIAVPSPALGGDTPASYMDTSEGQELVSGLIAKMQSGAYA